MSFWIENAIQPGRHILVDCGYWGEQTTQERFDRLRKHVALRNCQRVGNDRLLVRLPPRLAPVVLASMPEIKPGRASYCWCTHGFEGPNAEFTERRQASGGIDGSAATER
jgi:hypothetical protein